MAAAGVDNIIQNGRYYAQAEAEKRMPADVINKLRPRKTDSFLDVGCGLGVNLLECLKYTPDCSACDHENILNKLKEQSKFSDVNFYPGDFLSINFDRKFSKILIYGVVPALPNKEVLLSFIEKGVSLLEPDGMMLIGDFSNVDKKKRFMESKRGLKFQKEWEEKQAQSDEHNPTKKFIKEGDEKAVVITDDIVLEILKLYRAKGFGTYLLNQPQDLPFGNTREDILIVGPEYEDE